MSQSFAAEVIADNSGKWVGNGLRFATKDEAEKYAVDLMWRWTRGKGNPRRPLRRPGYRAEGDPARDRQKTGGGEKPVTFRDRTVG